MEDEKRMTLVQEALATADWVMDNPDISVQKAVETIEKLSAIYTRLKFLQATSSGKDEKVYRETAAGVGKLIDALKYRVKVMTNDFGFGTHS